MFGLHFALSSPARWGFGVKLGDPLFTPHFHPLHSVCILLSKSKLSPASIILCRSLPFPCTLALELLCAPIIAETKPIFPIATLFLGQTEDIEDVSVSKSSFSYETEGLKLEGEGWRVNCGKERKKLTTNLLLTEQKPNNILFKNFFNINWTFHFFRTTIFLTKILMLLTEMNNAGAKAPSRAHNTQCLGA